MKKKKANVEIEFVPFAHPPDEVMAFTDHIMKNIEAELMWFKDEDDRDHFMRLANIIEFDRLTARGFKLNLLTGQYSKNL